MNPKTPTLPTVIITPSTPLYLLPTTRQPKTSRHAHYSHSSPSPFSYASSSPLPGSSSSSRGFTRKQHLISALELDPSPLPHPDDNLSEKSISHGDSSGRDFLLPSLAYTSPAPRHRKRASGLVLSLFILGLFGLVLVGPMLPYRWYTGYNVDGVESIDALNQNHELDAGPGAEIGEVMRRAETSGPGQGSGLDDTRAFGPGQDQMPTRRRGIERSAIGSQNRRSGEGWSLLD